MTKPLVFNCGCVEHFRAAKRRILQPGDFLGGCGHGRYHDRIGNCSGPADVRDQVL
jgi:hypothetical protein